MQWLGKLRAPQEDPSLLFEELREARRDLQEAIQARKRAIAELVEYHRALIGRDTKGDGAAKG